ncbi:MAG: hypothetical protein OHK0046_13190 [Anaerolineae bacterium]
MPQIILSSLPTEQATAQALQTALRDTFLSVAVADPTQDSSGDAAGADVLVILIGADWLQQITAFPAALAMIETGLRRSDMLVLAVPVEGASVPPVTALPPELRALAYMPVQPLAPGDAFEGGVRLITERILAYLQSRGTARVGTPTRQRGLPVNLLIIGTVLVIAVIVVLVPNLRGDPPGAIPPNPDNEAQVLRRLRTMNAETEVLIGLAAGLGENSESTGEELLRGAQLALQERPSITVGGQVFALDLLAQDSGCSGLGGLAVAEVFVSSENVAGIIGDMCNVSCTTSARLYNDAGYVTISPGCDAPELTANPSFNRTVPSAAQAGIAAADFAYNTLGVRRAAVIHDEIIIGGQLAAAFIDAFTALGGEITTDLTIETQSASIPAALDALLTGEPELIYTAGRGFNAGRLRNALAARDRADLPLLLAEAAELPNLIAEAENAEGVLGVRLNPPDNLQAVAARYENTFNTAPETILYARAYDAANILIDALEAVATVDDSGTLQVDRQALREAVRGYTGDGVTGILDCSGTGNCAAADYTAITSQNGEWVDYQP